MMLNRNRMIGLGVASVVIAVAMALIPAGQISADDVRMTVAPAIQRTDVSASSGTQVQQVCFGCRNRAAYRGWSYGGCYGCAGGYYSSPYYSGAYYPSAGYYQPYSGPYSGAYSFGGGYYQPLYGAYYGGYAGIAYGYRAPSYGYGYPAYGGYGYGSPGYGYSNSYSNYGVGVPAYGNAYATSYPESRYPAYGYGAVSTAYGGLGVQDW